jgi:hypothetical protein
MDVSVQDAVHFLAYDVMESGVMGYTAPQDDLLRGISIDQVG